MDFPISPFDGSAQLATRALPDMPQGSELRTPEDVERAAQMFEKLFAGLLVKEMRSTLGNGFFGQGPGSDVFGGWLDEHMGNALCAGRGLGVAEFVRQEMMQKTAPALPQPFNQTE